MKELPPLPPGMGPHEFGKSVMKWGSRDEDARRRIQTLTREELIDGGVTIEAAIGWRDLYLRELILHPWNPSAAGRAELMQRAADLLGVER